MIGLRQRLKSDEGSALVLALMFLLGIGLVIAALMGLTSTSFVVSDVIQSQRKQVYAVDGAVELAIQRFRQDGTCLSAPPPINSESVTVNCVTATSGSSGGGGANFPSRAVIIRANGSEEGIVQASGGIVSIKGGVASNTTVHAGTAASMIIKSGNLTARTGCTGLGLITVLAGTKTCDFGGGAFPPGDDPGWAPASASIPPGGTLPNTTDGNSNCELPAGPIELNPGTYSDGARWRDLFNDCSGRVFLLRAAPGGGVGVFYLSGIGEWAISNPATTIVAGTPCVGVVVAGCAAVVPTLSDIALLPVGQRCSSSLDGVQIVFGRDSRLNITSGSAELCPQPADGLSVYGAKSSATTITLKPVSETVVSSFTQSTAPAAREIDGNFAVATMTAAGQIAQLRQTGFDQSPIPPGATINSAILRVTHQELNSGDFVDPTVTIAPATGSAFSVTVPRNAAVTNFSADVTSSLNSAARYPISLNYRAALRTGGTRSGTARLDGIALKVTYTPAGYQGNSGTCLAVAPYDPSGSTCALIRTSGAQANFTSHGSVYAPESALDIQLTNIAYQVFSRGVVSRHLRINVTSSSDFTGDAFSLPEAAPLTTSVVFSATTADGQRQVRALVRFTATTTEVIDWSVDG